MKLSLVFVGAAFGEQCYEVILELSRYDTVEKAWSMFVTKYVNLSHKMR